MRDEPDNIQPIDDDEEREAQEAIGKYCERCVQRISAAIGEDIRSCPYHTCPLAPYSPYQPYEEPEDDE